ncbi:MAG: hypothetical protein ACE5FJ_03780 [Gemmatimonadales bacterium]
MIERLRYGLVSSVAMVSLLFSTAQVLDARGEPYLAIRTGLRCSQCHTNRTGGGGRTDFGAMYAQTRLAGRKYPFRNRMINDFLSVGGNFRLVTSGTVSDTDPRTTIELREANVQIEARLVPDRLALYIDETVGPSSASTREGFVILERLPLDGYLKVGKFLLPYGLRLLDDGEFIRQRTGFNYATPDQGVELGVEPGPLSVFLAVSNGAQGADENNSGKQVTATAALTFPGFRLGASASRNQGTGTRRDVVGGFGGFRLGRFGFMGEADLIIDRPSAGDTKEQFAVFVEGDFLAARGLNAKITYGFLDPDAGILDPDRGIGENARIRLRFGLEAFPIQFLQVSGFYTLLQDIPQATTDRDQINLEIHLYF